jgi:asparagine synthase (glutamine-hydrolysing)
MCGIAGFVGCDDVAHARSLVAIMTEDLKRRGPNAEGMECWPLAVLGHRRLSIFDLSDAGRQPMVSDDRSVAVVFNGAIYNFCKLRAELEGCGYVFHSQTDTEVLIHGYREWGIDRLLRRIRGMFAIALWDAAAQVLYLIRDRLGVKPLAYCHNGGTLAFASTVRALHRAGFGGEVDRDAVLEFLEFGYVTDKRAIYQNIRKVPAGGLIRFDTASGKLTEQRYWIPPEPASTNDGGPNFTEAVVEVERRLLDAVRLRLAADVKVAALLSGGIDSSLVCWGIRQAGGDLTAYTVSVPGDPADESGDAAVTAQKLGIRHEIIPVEADSAPDIADLIDAYGEPFACSSALGMLSVSKVIRSNATVLLTGDGGDDVFLGYPEHRNFWGAQQIAGVLPRPVLRSWKNARGLWPESGSLRRLRSFGDFVAGGLPAVAAIHDGLPNYGAILTGDLQNGTVAQRQMTWPADGGRTLLSDFLRYDFDQRFTGEYLPKVDGGTMYYALEARSPFLDQEVWEYAASLPFSVRLRNYELKAVLRHIAAQRISPTIAKLKKRGFTIPVQQWITTRWRKQFEDAFERPVLGQMGWIRPDEVRTALRAAVDNGRPAPLQLWYLFVLENWLKSA